MSIKQLRTMKNKTPIQAQALVTQGAVMIHSNHVLESINPVAQAVAMTAGLGLEFDRIQPAKASELDPMRDRIYVQENSCNVYRERTFRRHADLAVMMANGYKQIEKAFGYVEANRRLRKADEALTLHDFSLSVSDNELSDIADKRAHYCSRKITKYGVTYNTLLQCLGYADKYDITPPPFDDSYFKADANHRFLFDKQAVMVALEGALNRLACPIWWRRQFRRLQAFRVEQVARDLRVVHKKAAPYCSDFTVNAARIRKSKAEDILKSLVLIRENEDQQEDWLTLFDAAAKSHTAPKNRAAELMVRIRGFEEVAQQYGHVCEFYTLTTPSRFHAVNANGLPNSKYAYIDQREANRYLTKLFDRIRAMLAHYDLNPYGFRVVEPHHDGTPHWHLMLFVDNTQTFSVTDNKTKRKTTLTARQLMRKIFRDYALEDTPEECYRKSIRFKAVAIDPAKGSAAGYIAKYITKGISGEHLSTVKDSASGDMNIDPISASERIKVWASSFNIRQFQQIGGPSVSTWRELRRLGQGLQGACELGNQMQVDVSDLEKFTIEKVRQAADSSDWAAFCIAMGGVHIKRKDHPVRLCYHVPDIINKLTGEVSRTETRYGDKPAPRINGVVWDSVFIMTRFGQMTIKSKEEIKAYQKQIMDGAKGHIDVYEREGWYEPLDAKDLMLIEDAIREDELNKCFLLEVEENQFWAELDERLCRESLDLCH